MTQSQLLPKDKFDVEAVGRLRKLEKEQLASLLPELLAWIADLNWPICRDVIDLLLTVPEHVVKPIHKILNTDDEGWKCNCLDLVVRLLPREQRQRCRAGLERIAHEPTKEEIEEGTCEMAEELLESLEAITSQ